MGRTRTTRARLEVFALAFPDAWQDQPWEGDVVTKVGKKIFVFYGPDSIGVKLPESADMALEVAGAQRMAYGLGKWGWVSVPVTGPGVPARGVLEDWIEESYRAVATKTLVKRLDAERTGPPAR